ncbi:MAG: hypothetical protein ACYDBJ_10140, partial [Aggregatilineales bacterium]
PPSSITLLTSSGSPPNLRPQIRMHPIRLTAHLKYAKQVEGDRKTLYIDHRMSKETEPKHNLTIEQVASIATENVLRDGGHRPTLIAEGSRNDAKVEFDALGKTFEERQKQMIKAGFLLARNPQFGLLRQAFFISEGWMSMSPLDKPPTTPPAQDPNRKEVLIISGLTVENRHANMVIFEMIRDSRSRLRELKPFESFPDVSMSAESPLLEALFFGFAMGLSGSAA